MIGLSFLAGLGVMGALTYLHGLGGFVLGLPALVALCMLGGKLESALKKSPRVDAAHWVCPHCQKIIQRDAVQTELARRRYTGSEPIVIAAGSRHPTCPACTKPVDGRKLLSGGYDLPWARYLQLKKQGVLQ